MVLSAAGKVLLSTSGEPQVISGRLLREVPSPGCRAPSTVWTESVSARPRGSVSGANPTASAGNLIRTPDGSAMPFRQL